MKKNIPSTVQSHLKLFGERIQLARKKRGLTVLEVSKRIGVDRRSITQLEKGTPGCSIGMLFSVLHQFDLLKGFDAIVDPSLDLAAIESELKQSRSRNRIKKIPDEKVNF